MGFSLSRLFNPKKHTKDIKKLSGKVFKGIGKADPITKKLLQNDPLMRNNPIFSTNPLMAGARELGKKKNPKRAKNKRNRNLPLNERSRISMANMLARTGVAGPSRIQPGGGPKPQLPSTLPPVGPGGMGGRGGPGGLRGGLRGGRNRGPFQQPVQSPQQGQQQQLAQQLAGMKQQLASAKGGSPQQPGGLGGLSQKGSPQVPQRPIMGRPSPFLR